MSDEHPYVGLIAVREDETANHETVVYYMTNYLFLSHEAPIKIGRTNNLPRRMSQHAQRKDMFPIVLGLEIDKHATATNSPLERARHQQFKPHQVVSEWFWPTRTLVEHVNTLWQQARDEITYDCLNYFDTEAFNNLGAGRR